MDKNRISNHNWICRTLAGTIALEEIPMPLKQRNFLKHLAKPVRVSDVYKILKEKYPNDYSKTSDFVQLISLTNKKLWIEKVEKPQDLDDSEIKTDDSENSFDDSRDSSSLPEELLTLSRKAQSGYSEESNVFAIEFEDPKEKEDIKKWFDEEDEYEVPEVEFVPDEQTKDLILKLGLGSLNENNIDELEIPEEDPFNNKDVYLPKTEAANQVLQALEQFKVDEFENEDLNSDESTIINENSTHNEESINYIFNQTKESDEDNKVIEDNEDENKEPAIPVNNIKEISSVDREMKRQERLSKRNPSSSPKKNDSKKEQGLLGSLKNGIKKIIGK